MITKSLSLILGIAVLTSSFPKVASAYPVRTRTNPYPGIHRTIISPNSGSSGSYRGNHRSSYNRGNRNFYSRERVIIERDNRGYCSNCRYDNRSNYYSPSRSHRGYGRSYYPSGRYYSPSYNHLRNRY